MNEINALLCLSFTQYFLILILCCFQTSEGGAYCGEMTKLHITDTGLAEYLMRFFAGKRVASFGEGIGKRNKHPLRPFLTLGHKFVLYAAMFLEVEIYFCVEVEVMSSIKIILEVEVEVGQLSK